MTTSVLFNLWCGEELSALLPSISLSIHSYPTGSLESKRLLVAREVFDTNRPKRAGGRVLNPNTKMK